MALILSALGIYGVISYSVAQRTCEMGIRIALGARAEDVLRLMMRQAVRLSIIGVITGTLLGLGLTHVMESLLYGVSRTTRASSWSRRSCWSPWHSWRRPFPPDGPHGWIHSSHSAASEEVRRCDLPDVIPEKCPPRL